MLLEQEIKAHIKTTYPDDNVKAEAIIQIFISFLDHNMTQEMIAQDKATFTPQEILNMIERNHMP